MPLDLFGHSYGGAIVGRYAMDSAFRGAVVLSLVRDSPNQSPWDNAPVRARPSCGSLDIQCFNSYNWVMPSLSTDLRQGKPFDSLQQEAFLSVARTAAVLQGELDPVLAPHELSLNQYNVLRVLRGAGDNGLCRNEIRDRLITRMPDASRLLDRMEALGLIRRVRSTTDRRLVNTTLTEAGMRLVSALDAEVAQVHARQFAHLSASQLRTLVELLSQARDRP